ncbi:MAG: hypothetical protein ACI94Y_002743 [Maribacter sp.]
MKLLVTVLLLTFTVFSVSAQDDDKAFQKGDVMLSIGIGAGVYGNSVNGLGFSIPVVFNADFGLHGYVSVGAYAGFWRSNAFNTRYNSIHIGARGSFHFWQLIDDKVDADLMGDKLDIYATVWVGYNLRKFSSANINDNRVQVGSQIGVRYFIKKNFGFFAEVGGAPTSYSNVGITLKF